MVCSAKKNQPITTTPVMMETQQLQPVTVLVHMLGEMESREPQKPKKLLQGKILTKL